MDVITALKKRLVTRMRSWMCLFCHEGGCSVAV